MSKPQLLEAWSRKWTPRFNALSAKYNTPYYTQSPLCAIADEVDVLFAGINPQGSNSGTTRLTEAQFLAGNNSWEERFKDDKNVWKFTNGARFFMGYDASRHAESIDNDSRVVWTNLSPFQSRNGFLDLKAELRDEGVRSFIELIVLLQPKKIVFLGGNAFSLLDKYADESVKQHISHLKVFRNLPLEIGRIFDKPACYVPHPSGKWPVSHCFVPVFIFLRELCDVYEEEKPLFSLEEVRAKMRREWKLWQDGVEIEE